MTPEKEMLELAAKAMGYTLKWGEEYMIGDGKVDCTDMSYVVSNQPDEADWYWSPLEDDGDALRLAVKLGIGLDFLETANNVLQVWANHHIEDHIENAGTDPYAATRRVIVRAAAEIGRSMK